MKMSELVQNPFSSEAARRSLLKCESGQVLVAHAGNSSHSGGGDQEDHGSKPAWANSSGDPTSKISNIK
jgi:hypothetical protein